MPQECTVWLEPLGNQSEMLTPQHISALVLSSETLRAKGGPEAEAGTCGEDPEFPTIPREG